MAEGRQKEEFQVSAAQLWMLLYVDDQVISNGEGDLQRAAYKLNQIITEHGATTKLYSRRSQNTTIVIICIYSRR